MLWNYGKLNNTWIIPFEERNIMTWHDSWQYVITWHTSHDVKHKIWHLTSSICRCEWTIERWFYFCFARYLGREIHSNYRRLGDLYACIKAWPWNWRSRHGLHDLCYLCLYLSYRDDLFVVLYKFQVRKCIATIAFAYPSRLTLKLNVTSWSMWYMSFLPVFVVFCVKYACIRIRTNFNSNCSPMSINDNSIAWSNNFKYLGIVFNSGEEVLTDLKSSRNKFFRSFNCIYSKISKANESVIVSLLKVVVYLFWCTLSRPLI